MPLYIYAYTSFYKLAAKIVPWRVEVQWIQQRRRDLMLCVEKFKEKSPYATHLISRVWQLRIDNAKK